MATVDDPELVSCAPNQDCVQGLDGADPYHLADRQVALSRVANINGGTRRYQFSSDDMEFHSTSTGIPLRRHRHLPSQAIGTCPELARVTSHGVTTVRPPSVP